MTVRASCPACGRQVAVLADGRIGRHGSTSKGGNCGGWGQLPKEDRGHE